MFPSTAYAEENHSAHKQNQNSRFAALLRAVRFAHAQLPDFALVFSPLRPLFRSHVQRFCEKVICLKSIPKSLSVYYWVIRLWEGADHQLKSHQKVLGGRQGNSQPLSCQKALVNIAELQLVFLSVSVSLIMKIQPYQRLH